MGPVVRLHHSDEIPTAVLENTERDEERSRVEGKVKVGDWRGILESRVIAPDGSGSVRQKFTGSVRGARNVGRNTRTSPSWYQLRSYRRTSRQETENGNVGKRSREGGEQGRNRGRQNLHMSQGRTDRDSASSSWFGCRRTRILALMKKRGFAYISVSFESSSAPYLSQNNPISRKTE